MEGCDVNATNFDGRTALHVMVARNRFECVVTLLAHDADIDVLDNEGNAALHIAIEKKLVPIVQCLVVFGCDINQKNKSGKTPRHMVGNDASGNKEDEILYILHSVGAKRCSESSSKCPPGCNARDSYNGIPPEAPDAVEQREHIENMLATTSRQMVGSFMGAAANGILEKQAPSLWVFVFNRISNLPKDHPPSSCRPVVVDTEKEQKGQSIMDALLGMFTTKVNADELTRGNSSGSLAGSRAATPQSASPEQLPSPTSPFPEVGDKPYGRGRLLCLDGGGIRGLVLVQMLLEVEKLSRTPIIHMFDWIAGTSTGGILALGLGCGKTMRQCMGLYLRMKEQCFVGSRPYNSEYFEAILKDNLGEFNVMTDIKHPKIMVTGVMADRKPVDLHLFRNYTSASDILGIVTPISE